MRNWPKAVIEAIRAELQGNARRDLVSWAHGVNNAKASGRKVSADDLDRARLVLDLWAAM